MKIKPLLDPSSNSLHSFEKALKICQFVGNYDAKPNFFRTGAVTAAFELGCSEYLTKKVDGIYIVLLNISGQVPIGRNMKHVDSNY